MDGGKGWIVYACLWKADGRPAAGAAPQFAPTEQIQCPRVQPCLACPYKDDQGASQPVNDKPHACLVWLEGWGLLPGS